MDSTSFENDFFKDVSYKIPEYDELKKRLNDGEILDPVLSTALQQQEDEIKSILKSIEMLRDRLHDIQVEKEKKIEGPDDQEDGEPDCCELLDDFLAEIEEEINEFRAENELKSNQLNQLDAMIGELNEKISEYAQREHDLYANQPEVTEIDEEDEENVDLAEVYREGEKNFEQFVLDYNHKLNMLNSENSEELNSLNEQAVIIVEDITQIRNEIRAMKEELANILAMQADVSNKRGNSLLVQSEERLQRAKTAHEKRLELLESVKASEVALRLSHQMSQAKEQCLSDLDMMEVLNDKSHIETLNSSIESLKGKVNNIIRDTMNKFNEESSLLPKMLKTAGEIGISRERRYQILQDLKVCVELYKGNILKYRKKIQQQKDAIPLFQYLDNLVDLVYLKKKLEINPNQDFEVIYQEKLKSTIERRSFLMSTDSVLNPKLAQIHSSTSKISSKPTQRTQEKARVLGDYLCDFINKNKT